MKMKIELDDKEFHVGASRAELWTAMTAMTAFFSWLCSLIS